uniref:Uncharacterized protein n=1 Tax=Anguilla anguilla TaxID=7936 RepID=A0A0E9PUR7_ANGAN
MYLYSRDNVATTTNICLNTAFVGLLSGINKLPCLICAFLCPLFCTFCLFYVLFWSQGYF